MSEGNHPVTSQLAEILGPLEATISNDAVSLPSGQGIAWRPPEGVFGSNPAVAHASAVIRIAAEHAHAREEVYRNGRLTPEAKKADLEEIDQQYRAKMTSKVSELEGHADKFEMAYLQEISAPSLEPGDAVSGLADREVRDHLASLPLAEQLALVKDGPETIVNAVLRSPLPMPEQLQEVAHSRRLINLESDTRFKSIAEGAELARWSKTVAKQAQGAVYSEVKIGWDERTVEPSPQIRQVS